ncbi:MAG: valine--tRNA ligase [Chloroflexi bacterium]|nr:valine--tRNA ligase [Chloroflexota bacterium]
MSQPTEMPKAYDPHQVEERLYEWWEKNGYFKPQIDPKKKPFVISIPPPNVTGELHHGHAMFLAYEDLMIRWHRMMGEPTLWVPGSDHAGIATQNVVEKALEKQGIKRRDIGREEFVKHVWEWKAEYGSMITHQIRRMGASCDWTRERFTLDEGLSRAVREAFVRLYEKGLIYRGPRLVNWCPRDESAISDLEVEHEDEQGKLYYVKYRLEAVSGQPSADEFIMVATTRPETILGDTAVAVNPKDERYQHLIGRMAILPALGRRIPIIADDAVDTEFGTGAVKVTPGHDPTDYEIGARHNLPIINIMNTNATINSEGGPYAGLDRYDARKKLVEDLQRDGLLDHIEDHAMSIGRCQRCDAIIEPLISTQWFVKIAPLAKPAIKAVKKGDIKIVPERFSKIYFNWMENIKDWCISRQLWWGHRIPVWYCENGHQTCTRTDPTQCAVCGSTNIHQDEDVLDTWFSSGLWPFSTLGWPDETEDYKYFYPTSVLETGYDILFFWVARMIMDGLEFTGQVPFHTVYLHGLIRHKDGSKISKSNPQPGDNPLDVIADYSADALRFTIITSSAPGNDTKLDLEKVEHARNFGNKIWNMARFITSNLQADETLTLPHLDTLSLADRWILSRLNHTIAEMTKAYRDWDFGEGTRLVHDFLWSEFADWYIEAAKSALYGSDADAAQRTRSILLHTLDAGLRLLHPTMPFATEETWQQLRASYQSTVNSQQSEALIVAPWPKADKKFFDARAEKDFAIVMDIIRAIRNARTEFNVEPGKRIPAVISAGASTAPLLESQRETIALLARLDTAAFQIEKHATKPAQSLALVVGKVEIYLPIAGMIDVEKEKARLSKEIANVRGAIERAEKQLASDFATKAPKDVVQKMRDTLAANQERVQKLDAQLASLEGREIEIAKPRNTKLTKKTKTVKKRSTKTTKRAKTAKKQNTKPTKRRKTAKAKRK